MFIEGQIPVFGHFLDEWITVDSVVGIDEFFGRERCAALLTLVTVCAKTVAAWALATNIAIGEELMCLFVVELFGSLFDELALVIKFAEEIGCKLVMDFRSGTRINIKRDAKVGERLLDQAVIAIDDLLYGDAFLAGTDGDGYTMFVGAANEENFFALETKVADVDVGRNIYSCKVTDMNRSVGVRQGRGH